MARIPDDPRLARIRLRRELLGEGWTDRAIARDVAEGTLAKVRHGAYVAGSAWRAVDRDGRHELTTRAVLKQAQTRVVVSHASALPFYEASTWGQPLVECDVTREDGRTGRKEAGVRQHRGRILEGDVVVRHGVRVMSGTRTALEVTATAPLEPAFVAVSDLLRLGHTSVEGLKHRYALGIDRWEGTLATDLILRLVDPRMESVGEYRTFLICYREGLPAPVPQYEVYDHTGRLVAIVDFAWPELGVFLEFDGKVKYHKLLKPGQDASDVVVAEKRREDLVKELTNWRCIRLVWADLDRPQHTADRIRRVLFPSDLRVA
jgi:hypothetical protein